MPLVSVTVVCPGEDKTPAWALDVFEAAAREVVAVVRGAEGWPIWVHERHDGPTGPELLLAVDADPADLKRALVGLEESAAWGRLWDLDVIAEGADDEPVVVTRAMVGMPVRRCLLCERPSPECARARRHSVVQLLAAIAGVVDGTVGRIAETATASLLREARLTPKPGLVDAENAGAHDDMTLTTFERSVEAIAWYFATCARAGAAGRTFDELRSAGVAAEADMVAATGGPNTHKGAIFSLGLLCAAAGAAPDAGLEAWCEAVAAWAEPHLRAWAAAGGDGGTHGEQAFREARMSGARGEAASGFATVRDIGLPALRARLARTGCPDDALRWALVALMAANQDTNLYARGGVRAVREVRRWASGVLERDWSVDGLVTELRRADARFSEARWSPGGSADLLAVTWFLERLG